MIRILLILGFLVLWLASLLAAFSGNSPAAARQDTPARSQPSLTRGRYLAEEVAKCQECHTPRTDTGALDSSRWLQGAPIWIQPVQHFPNWADRAPALAGLPGYSDEQMRRVLEQGVGLNGRHSLRPPMHEYHMTPADSQAIIAYLRSLPAHPR